MRILTVLAVALSLLSIGFGGDVARADGCYLCYSGSACDQCRYGAQDTQDARKACEARGCKIQGTTSCSSAANIKVCAAKVAAPILACTK